VTLEPIGSDVRRELGRFGPQADLGPIVAAWPGVVGTQIAANSWPARVARDGTLHVAAASSTWAFELTQLETQICERLGAALGETAPARVRFAVGPLPERGPESVEEVRRTGPEVRAEHRTEAAELARGIADSKLRELVARAAAASLATAGDDRPV
jgi:hypothetical protein